MPIPEQTRTLSVAVSRRGAERLRAGHVWVYRSDVVEADEARPGSIVLVRETTGAQGKGGGGRSVRASQVLADRSVRPTRVLGTAFYSSSSQIALRMIATKPVEDVHQLVRERIRAAIAYRERYVRETNAYRVIF